MQKSILFIGIGVLIAALIVCVFAGCGKGKTAEEPVNTSGKPVQTATLSFSSFDGGGPEYNALTDDPDLLDITMERVYRDKNHEEIDGAGYDEVFTIRGLKQGSTTMTIVSDSPITGHEEFLYTVTVDDALRVRVVRMDDPETDADAEIAEEPEPAK